MKSNFLKIFVFVLFVCNMANSQIDTKLVQMIKPHPSVSNLMNFVDIPVNTHTGVPSIDIPLINLPTLNKNANINVDLSYHSAGVAFTSSASDVGTGWNLVAGGVISRTITTSPDEYLKTEYTALSIAMGISPVPLHQIVFDDIYSYNFMGLSGKFKIIYNQYTNEVNVEKLDVNNIMITCQMSQDTTINQKVESFTIYDSFGLKYIFNVKDNDVKTFSRYIPIRHEGSYDSQPPGIERGYTNAYHLSEVFDTNNNKLVGLTYTTHVKQPVISIYRMIVTNKLNKIEVTNIGTILFNYQYYTSYENTLNDPFQLNSIVLKNANNQVINKFNFDYIDLLVKERRRHLNKIEKVDLTQQKIEKHEFVYQTEIINTSPFYCNETLYFDTDKFGYLNLIGPMGNVYEFEQYITDGLSGEDFQGRTNKESCLYGSLKSIILPTGGKKEFQFESNTFKYSSFPKNPNKDYALENTDNHVYTKILSTNYTAKKGYTEVPFSITGTEPVKIFIKLNPAPYFSQVNDPVDEPLYASFTLVGNGESKILNRFPATCLGDFILLNPGNYLIKVGSIETSGGSIEITKKEYTTQPIKEWVYGGGLRIKKVSFYNTINDLTPAKEINYEYNLFDNQNQTSGELFDGFYRDFANKNSTNSQISYKNVKFYETGNNGYTKHTYESYFDSQFYINSANAGYYKNYFGYKNGLLKKQEVFNNSNKIQMEIINNYEFTESGNVMYINSMLDYNFGWFYAKPCWVKLASKSTKNYFYPNGSTTPNIVQSNETFTYNSLNKQIASHTVDNSVGDILTTNYFYHTGNSTFSQNRISEIERIETKRGTDLLSESKINYSNAFAGNQSYLPSTIEVKKGSSPSEVRLKNNVYDEFGHVLEVQQENGIKISYIYGYNKSQPIAKLENVAYSSISASVISNLQSFSNTGTETDLIAALNTLRDTFPNAMITTITYKPLIGVSTMTDPKGDTITYHYDSFNRLEFVKDKDGNILSENQYHYKN